MGHCDSKRSSGHAPVRPDQITQSTASMHRSGASFSPRRLAPPGAHRRRGAHLVTDILFWFLFVVDVFAGCYWLTSGLGALLVKLTVLPPNSARAVVLVLSALITPAAVRGLVLLLK